jgi:hypothetical protein
MNRTEDGKLTGEAEVKKEFANRAMIRIFTETVDGQSQMKGPTAGARYYDIPLKKFLKEAPPAETSKPRSSIALPSASKVAK